jgi:hypothetical protein
MVLTHELEDLKAEREVLEQAHAVLDRAELSSEPRLVGGQADGRGVV